MSCLRTLEAGESHAPTKGNARLLILDKLYRPPNPISRFYAKRDAIGVTPGGKNAARSASIMKPARSKCRAEKSKPYFSVHSDWKSITSHMGSSRLDQLSSGEVRPLHINMVSYPPTARAQREDANHPASSSKAVDHPRRTKPCPAHPGATTPFLNLDTIRLWCPGGSHGSRLGKVPQRDALPKAHLLEKRAYFGK